MFTGIVKEIGLVTKIHKTNDILSVTIKAPITAACANKGESIAIDGVCTTVVSADNARFTVELMPETCEVTTLGRLKVGNNVNLEQSLSVGDSLSGHYVTGHVDTVVTIEKIESTGDSKRLTFEIPVEHAEFIAKKGSVTLNGVSLTVSKKNTDTFSVDLIPHTIQHTTFNNSLKNDTVNLEVDILARYACQCLNVDKTKK